MEGVRDTQRGEREPRQRMGTNGGEGTRCHQDTQQGIVSSHLWGCCH